ncbi:MAG: polysaccharide biosynthesis tyrosine autokinase [Sporichthyaceae bacterium]|nr:polysaccharide biosynthesis tyrosine autokinase [Sporichthyaceae bacterium]
MSSDAIQLRDQVGVLRRRWRVVAATVVVAIGLGLLVSLLATPTYDAQTEVLLAPTVTGEAPTPEEVATEARTVVLFADQVIDTLELNDSAPDLLEDVVVEPDASGAAVMTISVTREDPDEAADIANTMAQAYIDSTDVENQNRVESLDERIQSLDGQIARLRSRLNDADEPRQRIRLASERRKLLAERRLAIDSRASSLREAGSDVDQAEVVTPALAPTSASSPQPLRIAALAGAIGLLIGIGLAYLRDYFDDTVRDEETVAGSVRGRPVLGQIPLWSRTGDKQPITLASPRAPASEAYRELGANIRFLLGTRRQSDSARREPGRVVLVSSAAAGDGKTATAVNLAIVASAANMRVVLVDANLRRPRIHELFDITAEGGLADVLGGGLAVRDSLVDIGLDNLLVLPGGDSSTNPADLLTSPRLGKLLTDLRHEADLVVVDSAAVLLVADALELARASDLTVLVARSKTSRGRDLAETVQRIDRVGGSTAGVVLNAVESNRGRSRDTREYGSR